VIEPDLEEVYALRAVMLWRPEKIHRNVDSSIWDKVSRGILK
jgi:hypothetical protein